MDPAKIDFLFHDMDSDSDEETVTELFFTQSIEDDIRLMVALSKEESHDRSHFRMAVENFLRKPPTIFKDHFRIVQSDFLQLCDILKPDLSRKGESGRLGLPVELKVAVSLIILGRGESFRGLETLGVSRSAAHLAFHSFVNAVTKTLSDKIRLPTEEEAPAHHTIFKERAGTRVNICPKIIGAVDGTHVLIRPPADDAGPWINRKGWPSLNVQAVVDGRCRFMHVSVGAPGRVHDARVFFVSGVVDLLPKGSIILGDAAYPLIINKTLTPVRDNGHLSRLEEKYNEVQSSLRMVVERAFGIWRKKWQILKDIQFLDSDIRAGIIITCCILHNLYLNAEDVDFVPQISTTSNPESPEEPDEEEYFSANQWRENIIHHMFA